jgi:hypothetical protein
MIKENDKYLVLLRNPERRFDGLSVDSESDYFVHRTRIQPTQIVLQPEAPAEQSEDKNMEPLLMIRPNPASTFVEIKYTGIETDKNNIILEIFNIDGKLIYNTSLDFLSTIRIETLNWKPGLYIANLKDSQKIIANYKLVIE